MSLTNFPNGLGIGGIEITEDGIVGANLNLPSQGLTASGAVEITSGLLTLAHNSTIIAATKAAPTAGDLLIIVNISASGTAAHTVTLPTGVTWDGTNRVATLNAPGEALVAIAVSATRYFVLVNLNAVAFS